MTETEIFEKLREESLEAYFKYIETIRKFSFEDTQHTKKRLELIDSFNHTVTKNLEYREFIRKIVPLTKTK